MHRSQDWRRMKKLKNHSTTLLFDPFDDAPASYFIRNLLPLLLPVSYFLVEAWNRSGITSLVFFLQALEGRHLCARWRYAPFLPPAGRLRHAHEATALLRANHPSAEGVRVRHDGDGRRVGLLSLLYAQGDSSLV